VFRPANVGDHGAAFPVEEVAEADLLILPHRAGVDAVQVSGDLKVDPQFLVPTQPIFKIWDQHLVVISLRDMPVVRESGHVVGKALQQLDHELLLK
jgi:hypothetical protein